MYPLALVDTVKALAISVVQLVLTAGIALHASAEGIAYTKLEVCESFDETLVDAIDKWQTGRAHVVAKDVRLTLRQDFCDAAQYILTRSDIRKERVTHVIADVVDRTLDHSVEKRRVGFTMQATLGVALGFTGFPRPVPKKYATVLISYTKPVDSLSVEREKVGLPEKIIVMVGRVEFVGEFEGKLVCRSALLVRADRDNRFTC